MLHVCAIIGICFLGYAALCSAVMAPFVLSGRDSRAEEQQAENERQYFQ
jgi:hypothetical protein